MKLIVISICAGSVLFAQQPDSRLTAEQQRQIDRTSRQGSRETEEGPPDALDYAGEGE